VSKVDGVESIMKSANTYDLMADLPSTAVSKVDGVESAMKSANTYDLMADLCSKSTM